MYLYSVETGDEVALPNKTIGQVNAIAFSSDSNILAMGGYLRPAIQLWNLKTRTELPPFSIPVSHRINRDILIQSAIALAFGVKDTILVCVSHFGEVTYWDMNTREKIVEHHTDADWDGNVLALSTDGRIFARGSGVGLHHGGPKGQISLWNTSAGNRETKTGGHSPLNPWSKKRAGIRALAFSPDGKTFASGSEDMTVRIWNTKRGSKRATLKGHTGWVTAVAFSSDGDTLASGDTDGTVRVWDAQKKRELAVLEGHSNTVVALAFTPDGNTLVSGSADGAIHFWNPNSGERIVFSDKSRITEIWDYNTREKVRTIEVGADAFAISQDGNFMACSEFKDISLWDLNTAELIRRIDTHAIKGAYGYSLQGAKGKVLTFSPDGSILLVSSVSRIHSFCSDAIDLIDIETGNKLHALPGHTEPIETLVFSHDGKNTRKWFTRRHCPALELECNNKRHNAGKQLARNA